MKKSSFYFIFLSIICSCFFSCEDETGPNTDFFKDQRDGQIYNTVQIGEQTWMAENLRYLPSKDEWSATESSPDHASSVLITHNLNDVNSLNFNKEMGFSVRCVRD